MIRGQDETRGRIERERVVRLATIGGRGRAHVVPGVFAVVGDVFCSPTEAGQGRSWQAAAQSGPGSAGHDPGRLLRRGLAEGVAVPAARHRPARVRSARNG